MQCIEIYLYEQTFRLFCTQKSIFFYFTYPFLQTPTSVYLFYTSIQLNIHSFTSFLLFPHSLHFSLTDSTLPKNTKILNARATTKKC